MLMCVGWGRWGLIPLGVLGRGCGCGWGRTMGDMQGRTGDGVEGEWKRRARGRRGGGDGKDYSGLPVEFVCEMLGGERTRSRRRCFGAWRSRVGHRWWDATGRARTGGCAGGAVVAAHAVAVEGGCDGSDLAAGGPYRMERDQARLRGLGGPVPRGGCSRRRGTRVDDRLLRSGSRRTRLTTCRGFIRRTCWWS